MGNSYGSPIGPMGEGAQIAGYEVGGTWYDVEGESPGSVPHADPPTENLLPEIDMVTVHVIDSEGTDFYYTLHGPWDDWETFWEIVDDLYTEYGGEAG